MLSPTVGLSCAPKGILVCKVCLSFVVRAMDSGLQPQAVSLPFFFSFVLLYFQTLFSSYLDDSIDKYSPRIARQIALGDVVLKQMRKNGGACSCLLPSCRGWVFLLTHFPVHQLVFKHAITRLYTTISTCYSFHTSPMQFCIVTMKHVLQMNFCDSPSIARYV